MDTTTRGRLARAEARLRDLTARLHAAEQARAEAEAALREEVAGFRLVLLAALLRVNGHQVLLDERAKRAAGEHDLLGEQTPAGYRYFARRRLVVTP